MMLNSYISISKYKLFVQSAILILLLLIALHVMYFEKFSRYIFKNDFSSKQFHYIKNNGSKIKVAAIGTSHTDDGLEHSSGEFFNYGRMSTYFPQVGYAKVSHLLKYATNLKVLLLEVDHLDILGYDAELQTSMPDNHSYLLTHVDESLYRENTTNIITDQVPFFISLHTDVAPIIHRKFFQNYLLGRGKQQAERSVWEKMTSKEKMESSKKRVHSSRLDSPLKIEQAVRDYYTKAITKAKEQGIKIYLMYYPQTREYFKAINEENNQIVNSFVSDLAKEKDVTVLDYRHYFESNESFFENQDHLNKKGSEMLTLQVLKAIKND